MNVNEQTPALIRPNPLTYTQHVLFYMINVYVLVSKKSPQARAKSGLLNCVSEVLRDGPSGRTVTRSWILCGQGLSSFR